MKGHVTLSQNCPKSQKSSPQISNLQIFKEKSGVSDQDPHWFSSIIIFYLFRLQNAM